MGETVNSFFHRYNKDGRSIGSINPDIHEIGTILGLKPAVIKYKGLFIVVQEERKRLIKISRFLSLVLRHKPETIGITLDPNGWVSVEGCDCKRSSRHTII